jgi:hypothetical protein
MLASIRATARRYEGISYTPDWPRREDIYYAHNAIPAHCPDHSRFHTFANFFCPCSEADRYMIMALICAPLWYAPGIPKPSWIIDSADGAGTGKTALVELVAQLYSSDPIRTNPEEISRSIQELIKRLLSSDGRTGRIVLVDNVIAEFRAPGLADLITSRSVSGRAPYGHGEEKRPNNLVYVITANSAQVDSDIATRSFYVVLKKTPLNTQWKTSVQNYIEDHRLEIIADIIHALASHDPFRLESSTRFPEFEAQVLQAVCRTEDAFTNVVSGMARYRAESNTDGLVAAAIRETFEQKMTDLGIDYASPVFIRSEVVNSWASKPIRDIQEWKPKPIQLVRNLAKLRMIPEVDPTCSRWPRNHAKKMYSGVAWNCPLAMPVATVVGMGPDGSTTKSIE